MPISGFQDSVTAKSSLRARTEGPEAPLLALSEELLQNHQVRLARAVPEHHSLVRFLSRSVRLGVHMGSLILVMDRLGTKDVLELI